MTSTNTGQLEAVSTDTDSTERIPLPERGRSTLYEQGKSILDVTEPEPETAPEPEPGVKEDPELEQELRAALSYREEVLDQASDRISGSAEKAYGSPQANLERIAALWTARDLHAGGRVYTAAEVAQMLALVKLSRLSYNESHADSWVDVAGYAALGGEVTR